MSGTSKPVGVYTKLQRIAELARQMPDRQLTSLSYHIDVEWLKEAYRRTRKDGAVGVDGQSAQQYAANLDANLESLLTRVKTASYRAPPVRRVHIPKERGTRPIGIPSFEDKVLQRAYAMALEAVYEQDFLDCSYGFRPGRSAHQALDGFYKQMTAMGGGWVLELDNQSFSALRGRCGHWLLVGDGRTSGPGSAAQALRQVRSDPPSGEDASCAIRAQAARK
jgi:retron-type reverse transcriptase